MSIAKLPRLPLEGSIDLTYRCNNNCRHCWLQLPPDSPRRQDELAFEEIKRIIDQSRAMGCRSWRISGGEPLLRPDFPEIFDYLTRKSVFYTLNTNGTLITPEIARLLTRKGARMIALYGATAEVYDQVTRHPGGFEKAMRGLVCLKEAGVDFIVQLIPMRANWHQWEKMVELAKSLSKHWRVGASWLYLSAEGDPERNREIAAQRLSPREVIALDQPYPGNDEQTAESASVCGTANVGDDRLFAPCIAVRRNFHIDPYGRMSWCSFIKDPSLRYDLRQGDFQEAWDKFIPACADKVRGGAEWQENCGSCENRGDCRWCAVYSCLETGRYSAPVPYLCEVAKEVREFKDNWQKCHRRYFRIAGITVRVESDLAFDKINFKRELTAFAADGPGDDNITFRHHFDLPDLAGKDLGRELYRKPPWAISRSKTGIWYYRGISPATGDDNLHRLAVFNADHTRATIYSPTRFVKHMLAEGWHSLSLFPTDQIWLAPLLADRNAILIHSAAAIVNGMGLVFVGHSDAGKSTTMELLKQARRETGLDCEILCDDRNVVRFWTGHSGNGGWRVHGTWSHGTTPDVSPADAPLGGIFFLKQDKVNKIVPLTDRKAIWRELLATLVRPMVTAEWWQKELDVLEKLVNEAPCHTMHFDKSGEIVGEIREMVRDWRGGKG